MRKCSYNPIQKIILNLSFLEKKNCIVLINQVIDPKKKKINQVISLNLIKNFIKK